MEDMTMATLPSSTQTDVTDTTTTHTDITTTISCSDSTIKTTDLKNAIRISSTHPRFSTLDIIQNFPNIQHRFCHKIKVSIPWKEKDIDPNLDTYYKAIRYFFATVKKFDSQFQILTWNIHDKDHNTISDVYLIPTTHKELGSYLYNVHVSPSRIRASMVVTSTFNLSQLVRNQPKTNDNQINLFKVFQQEKLWVQPTSIQTMGEIKLIGFLQYVHPYQTNLKQLLAALQAIVETRDIVIEIYRPRALNKDKSIITAPEAIAIGAPSDISVNIYKSLMEKWRGVVTGEFDLVIGENNIIKKGFFIPFAHSLLSQEVKNEAIINHGKFVAAYTGIKLRRCTSIDERFELTHEETTRLGYKKNKENTKMNTTLRQIIESWKEKKQDTVLIESIEPCNTNMHILLVKKRNKERTNKKLNQLIEVLSERSDFPTICGNTDRSGANIDRFSLSKSGRGYLNYLKDIQKSPMNTNDDCNTTSGDKRKRIINRPPSVTTTTNEIETPSTSPVHKKSNIEQSVNNKQESKLPTTDSGPIEASQATINGDVNTQILKKKPTVTFQQALLSTPTIASSSNTIPPQSILKRLSRKDTVQQIKEKVPHQQPSGEMVKFVEVPSTTVTLSTMTTDGICQPKLQENTTTKISDTQIQEITNAVSQKYDTAIQRMQEAHEVQLKSIIQTQKRQDNEMFEFKTSQNQLREEIQTKFDQKMNSQTSLLHSMLTMIQDIKKTQISDKAIMNSRKEEITMGPSNVSVKPSVITHSQDNDLSFSDTDYEHDPEGKSEVLTAATVQSTVNLSQRCSPKPDIAKTSESINSDRCSHPECIQLHCRNGDDKTQLCHHINDIAVDSSNDIRQMTLTSTIEPCNVDEDLGWNNITDTSRNKIPLKHAIISPQQKVSRSKYKIGSPSYNKYDPTGKILRSSQRLKNKYNKGDKDRSNHTNVTMVKSDRTV